MIECKDGLFHLRGEGFSYLFRLTPLGQPEHIHFGRPVAAADAAALCCKPGLGWGTAVLLRETPPLCLEWLPLEWSGQGRGDYRESPLQLGSGRGSDFRYVSHRVTEGAPPMTGGLPQAHGGAETLTLCLRDEALDCTLTLYYTLFGGVLTRRAALRNDGASPVTVEKLMSFSLDLPGDYVMVTLNGDWIAETHRHDTPVGPARVVNESDTGFSSNRHNPGFLLREPETGEDTGRVYGFNLIYSGNHYAAAQASPQGLCRVMQGVLPQSFRRVLAPGETLETPEAALAFSDGGLNDLSARMHDFVNRHIVPETWAYRPRPVLYNDWEGCMFDFTRARLTGLAKKAAALGCELFVLDDGWFGARDNDRAGLGDYNVNEKKLPGGLGALAAAVNGLGMDFGLWFEPEAVNPDSDLYRAHPDWALTEPGRDAPLSRHELLLDLTRPAVRDYIVASVSAVLESAPIRYVKWDMNRHSAVLGERSHDYILGLYDVLRRIFTPRPEVLLEGCSSGGNRFDLGILCFAPQIWCSDDTDPIERLDIQGGLSLLYPQSAMGAHVSAAPHAQTLRQTPLSTRGNVSCFGCLGYELDLRELLPVEEREIKNQIAFYKAHRETLQFGRFRRLPAEAGAVAWQVSGEKEHIAGLFHRLTRAGPGYERLRLKGLTPEKRYRVQSRRQSLRVGAFGGLVKHISPIRLDPNGPVLRLADRHYAMTDGQEDYAASGAALLAGLCPAGRFTGTGYDPGLRMQADLGSALYLIEEEQSNDENR